MPRVSAEQVRVKTQGSVSARMRRLAAEKVGALLRLAPGSILSARVTLTRAADPAVQLPAVARASVAVDGRLVRAQAAGENMLNAIERLDGRLRVRMERASRDWEARRGGLPAEAPREWRHQSVPAHRPSYFPRPAEERQVIRRTSFAVGHETVREAVGELNLLDYDFHLFTDRVTGQDSVVYRTLDGYGLARAGADAGAREALPADVVPGGEPVPRLTVRDAGVRLEVLGGEFLFFTDTVTRRGNVIYHRYDGHYGLIVPAGAR